MYNLKIEAIAKYFNIPRKIAMLRMETMSQKRLNEILRWYYTLIYTYDEE